MAAETRRLPITRSGRLARPAGRCRSGKSTRRSDGSSPTQQASEAAPTASAKKKLSYLEAREFAAIEQLVEVSDQRLAHARARVEDLKSQLMPEPSRSLLELDAAQHENDTLYARWAELTEKAGPPTSVRSPARRGCIV